MQPEPTVAVFLVTMEVYWDDTSLVQVNCGTTCSFSSYPKPVGTRGCILQKSIHNNNTIDNPNTFYIKLTFINYSYSS